MSLSSIPLPSLVVNSTAAAQFALASALSKAQQTAWSNVFATLRSGGTVSVVTIGGSMARGQGCTEHDAAQTSCSYSGRLVSWLRRAFPSARILFENRAIGGMTTGVSLLTLPSLSMPVRPDDDVDNEDEDYDSTARPSSGASILLIDYAINDAFELQVQNSRLSVDVYKNAKRTLKPLNQSEAVYLQVVAATEAMVRFLLNGARVRSALLVVEGSCWRSTRNTVDAHASVARHYGVPFFDFAATLRNGIRPVQSNYMQQLSAWSGGPMRSMMRRDNTICDACIRTKKLGCESSRTPVIFSDGKHPDYRGHIYVASALKALLNAWAHDPILSSTSAPAALAPPPRDEDLPSPSLPPHSSPSLPYAHGRQPSTRLQPQCAILLQRC